MIRAVTVKVTQINRLKREIETADAIIIGSVHMIFCIQKSSNPFVELLPYFFYFIVTGLYRLQFFIRQFLNFFQWQVKIYCNFF